MRLPLVGHSLLAGIARRADAAGAAAKLAPVAAAADSRRFRRGSHRSRRSGGAVSLAQVRVIFAKPVDEGGGALRRRRRAAYSITSPRAAARRPLRVLTPRMIGFVADQALPIGTRVRVTLTSGLRDLDGDALASDLAWTFETAPLAFSDLPQIQRGDDESTAPPVTCSRPSTSRPTPP